jgi:serine/threonine protein phosphatase PrpC
MDMLRKIFGLKQAPITNNGETLEGATAPLNTAASAKKEETKSNPPRLAEDRTQRLPDLDEVSSGRGGRLVYGLNSDVGQIRTNNQDAIFSFYATSQSADTQPDFGMFVVADGMGGHHDGEKASALTARLVSHYVSRELYLPLLNPQNDNEGGRPTIMEIMRQAVQEANRVVTQQVPEGGTTLTAAAIMGDLVYIAHVGDSRAYVLDKGHLEQLTRDHSLVQRLIELEQLTPEEALEHPQRNVLYRAIGQNEDIEVDAITRRLPPGARLLLCSDGLWNIVPEQEIVNTVITATNPQSACEALVRLANERGGPDNISVILVKIPE